MKHQLPCLIVAAGTGSRLKDHGPSKPLVLLNDRPILSHVMENAVKGGVNGFVIVTGFMADEVSQFAKDEASRLNVTLDLVYNPEFEKPNGLSVVAAKACFDGPFLLSMSDHLMDPEMVRAMIEAPHEKGETLLGIDRGLDNPFVDLEDVTRVMMDGDKISSIGKLMPEYNAFDTGIFKADPDFFDALIASGVEDGDFSISGGMMRQAAQGKARGYDIGNRVWIDVDDPMAFSRAQAYLDGTLKRLSA